MTIMYAIWREAVMRETDTWGKYMTNETVCIMMMIIEEEGQMPLLCIDGEDRSMFLTIIHWRGKEDIDSVMYVIPD